MNDSLKLVTLVTLACVPTHQALWMLAFPRGWLEEMAFDVRADLPHVSADDILKGLLAWYPRSLQIKTAATHRTITHDTWGGRYPFTVWSRISQGMLGEPYQTHQQAQRACAKLPKEVT